MRPAALVVAFIIVAGPAAAADIVRCAAPDRVVDIELGARRFQGQVMDCVSGDFIEDMTPCAPPGKYALSYPTGNAGISRIVSRWQDYGGHLGGVTGNATRRATIALSGGWMGPGGLVSKWFVTVDRISGKGTLGIYRENSLQAVETPLQCRKARLKL